MKAIHLPVLAALALAAPSFAGEMKQAVHAKKGEHKEAPASFAARPPDGTWAKCAVSGDVFQISKDTEFSTYAGRTYAFCCAECKPDFDKDPAKYAPKS
jgi:YHS domain-containing protein